MLAFTLTMPGVGSWDGKWTGEGRIYVRTRAVRDKEALARALPNGKEATYSYAWNDGWRASVHVQKVDSREAERLRRASIGFMGYDWMIDSILAHGEIRTNSD